MAISMKSIRVPIPQKPTGMVLLKPTSSPLNLNSVPLESRQLMFGAGRHSTLFGSWVASSIFGSLQRYMR
ncbi:hypothetical protein EYF80_024040 [Liparis tanakae]|uniref:Uncharacterized protein n=1 Tax=Liparis tanakae TaxID=230148 RepID=A0A4Z2HIZ1_9TELE|nr:hypothetical protein EYF80_024040 [Liparis tanakae]